MKKCPICKKEITGTARWYYRYKTCKSCTSKLKRKNKIEKYDTWKKKG